MTGRYLGTVGFKHRSALKLLTLVNGKTPKGEQAGYLSAILYLMPHSSGGGADMCPHSTGACRSMCLSGSGLSGLPRATGAKQKCTDYFNRDRAGFIADLLSDIKRLQHIAAKEGLLPAVRLNGTSDYPWERYIDMRSIPIRWYDYTKWPLENRWRGNVGPGDYHLTYSVGGPQDMGRAIQYLRHGQSVAIVTPEIVKHGLVGLEMDIGGGYAGSFEDGDEHDLRFLDPPASIVLLKHKGHVVSDLSRPHVLNELRAAARMVA
jgi:hypothetical protein